MHYRFHVVKRCTEDTRDMLSTRYHSLSTSFLWITYLEACAPQVQNWIFFRLFPAIQNSHTSLLLHDDKLVTLCFSFSLGDQAAVPRPRFCLTIHPLNVRHVPLPLHMEQGSRSLAVWRSCVLTQPGSEDGILIGLIELMALSPLVGEECQASCSLFAGWWLRDAVATLRLSLCVRLCLSFNLHQPSLPLNRVFLFITHLFKAALIMFLLGRCPIDSKKCPESISL